MTKAEIINAVHQMARSGQAAAAAQQLGAIVQQHPADPDFAHHLGLLHLSMPGQIPVALPHLERSVLLAPQNAEYRSNYATALNMIGRHEEAAAEYRRAVAIRPDSFPALLGLSSALISIHDYPGGLSAGRSASALDPSRPEPWSNIASALMRSGRSAEAVKTLEKALTRIPGHPMLLLQMASNLHYRPDVPPERIRHEHERLGAMAAASMPPPAAFSNVRDPERPLRVGYVSADFRDHSIAHFFRPVLAGHDPARVSAVCYSAADRPDDTTGALRALAPKWRDIARISDADLESYVRGDQIDILVDLGGHTTGSRVFAFARRLAPVQISYLGYPNTTGLAAMDYRIVDSRTDPEGAERYSTERLIRLDPCFLCYAPPPDAPEPAQRPERGVIFGSFNAAQKIVEPVVSAWAALLKEVPGSRLLLKTGAFDSPTTLQDFKKRFEAEGIDGARLDLRGRTPSRADHLAAYNQIDVALDTFPYCGTTTTCEALLMGVPVVTLEGATHAARVGASLLGTVGLGDLVATSVDDYVGKAAALARDLPRRRSLHETLRPRLLASPLCDAPGFARRLESAYQDAWRRWCAEPRH